MCSRISCSSLLAIFVFVSLSLLLLLSPLSLCVGFASHPPRSVVVVVAADDEGRLGSPFSHSSVP